MAEKIKTPVTSGFFSVPFKPTSQPLDSEPSFIKVGEITDSAFKGAVVSMIDNILSLKSRGHQELAKRLSEHHAQYFKQPSISGRLITPIQHLEKLLETPHARAKFINEFAYYLRQITVTEILRELERYHLACFAKGEILTPAQMREPSVQLDKCALSALSKVMQVPLELYEDESNKGLRKRMAPMNVEVKQPIVSPIILLLQGGTYFPLVRKAEYFALVNKYKAEPIKPKPLFSSKDPELADILKKINEEEKYLLQQFDKEVTRLNKMLQAGELTKESLLAMYIKNIPSTEQYRNTKYAGVEFGSQQWFERIKVAHNAIEPVELTKKISDRQEETKELVEALARGICTGEVDATLVYEDEENPSLIF